MSAQLDTYLARGTIDRRQYNAGKAFSDDFAARYPGMSRRGTLEPKVQRSRDDAGFSMGGIAAARAGKACTYLGELRHIAIAVCVEGWSAGQWIEEKCGGKQSDGIVLLRHALDGLHRFYAVD